MSSLAAELPGNTTRLPTGPEMTQMGGIHDGSGKKSAVKSQDKKILPCAPR